MGAVAKTLLEQTSRDLLKKLTEFSKVKKDELEKAQTQIKNLKSENDRLSKAALSSPNAGDIGGTGSAPNKGNDISCIQPGMANNPVPPSDRDPTTLPSSPDSTPRDNKGDKDGPHVAWDDAVTANTNPRVLERRGTLLSSITAT